MEASAVLSPGAGRTAFGGRFLRFRTDDQLVALFRLGDDEAFRVIHDRYRQRLFAYTRQMLAGSRPDAEDALQDVFVRAYSALRGDDRPVTLRAWLYRVAHNRCIDELRRPVPRPVEVLDVSRGPDLQDPLVRAQQRDELRRLVTDVQRLPEQQRSALLMREVDGLSHLELADALGVTVPAVKSLLVRARIGLAEAGAARDAACAEIRHDIAEAADRRVRCSGRARRHLQDCRHCRRFREDLRARRVALAALSPPPGVLAALTGLLGAGAAGGGTAAGGGGAAAAGAATLGTAAAVKVAAVVCTVAVVGGGAVVHERAETAPQRAAAPRAAETPAVLVAPPVAPRLVAVRAGSLRASVPASRRRAAGTTPPSRRTERRHRGGAPVAGAPSSLDGTSGGARAPAEDELLARVGGAGAGGIAPPAGGATASAEGGIASAPADDGDSGPTQQDVEVPGALLGSEPDDGPSAGAPAEAASRTQAVTASRAGRGRHTRRVVRARAGVPGRAERSGRSAE